MAERKRYTDNSSSAGQAKSQRDTLLSKKKRKEKADRNHFEGKFGQGKNGYSLNQIRARQKETSESWVACTFFVMNLLKYAGDFYFAYFLALNKWLRQTLSAQSVSSGHINESSMNFQPDNNRIKLCPLKIAC